MPYELFLAFRYLRARHKQRLARVTAFAAVIGIAMGVAALIVALALSNGFRDEMRDKILQGTAHINVLKSDGYPITNNASITAQIRQIEGVTNASPTTYDGAVARGPRASGYAVLRGIAESSAEARSLRQWLDSGSLFDYSGTDTEPQVVIGDDLANRLGLSVGDVFQVVPAGSGVNSSNLTTRRVRVRGIFHSGLFEYDSTWIYLPLETAAAFTPDNHSASIISVQVKDVDDVKRTAEQISSKLGSSYKTVDWQQANQPLFTALALERRMGLFIIGLIIAIAALNITTMLILVVVERRRDIAILSALGAMRKGIMLVFIIEGAVVGSVGALSGVLVGLLVCSIGNHYKLVSLPADVYSISNVPLHSRIGEVVIAAIVAFVLSVLATIYPARAAAKMRSVEILREVN
jgi:lipoprotein-releasing system permease protein